MATVGVKGLSTKLNNLYRTATVTAPAAMMLDMLPMTSCYYFVQQTYYCMIMKSHITSHCTFICNTLQIPNITKKICINA